MRTLIVCMLLAATAHSQNYYGSHFMVGMTAGATITSLPKYKPEKAALMGVLIGTGFGLLKETTDVMRGSKFNTTDAWYTMFGSMVGSVAMYHLRKHFVIQKRKNPIKL